MSWPYRCSRTTCRQRVSLPRTIERYARPKLCPACAHDTLRLDRWKKRDHRRSACHCEGYIFRHRRGSLRCRDYRGSRIPEDWKHDLEWGRMNNELSARPIIEQPGEEVPF